MRDHDRWITALTEASARLDGLQSASAATCAEATACTPHKSWKCLTGTAYNQSSIGQPGRSHADGEARLRGELRNYAIELRRLAYSLPNGVCEYHLLQLSERMSAAADDVI